MRPVTASPAGSWWHRQIREIREPVVGVALAAGACEIVLAVIAKNVLEVELDWFAMLVPWWIFIAYLVSEQRSRASEIASIAATVLATAAVLVLYAV